MIDNGTIIGALASVIGFLLALLITILAWQWKRQVQRIDGMASGTQLDNTIKALEKHINDDATKFEKLFDRDDDNSRDISDTNRAVATIAATIAVRNGQNGK